MMEKYTRILIKCQMETFALYFSIPQVTIDILYQRKLVLSLIQELVSLFYGCLKLAIVV